MKPGERKRERKAKGKNGIKVISLIKFNVKPPVQLVI